MSSRRSWRSGRSPRLGAMPQRCASAPIRCRTIPRRYFKPGRNWAEWALFLVPVFGGTLVGLGGASIADHAWPWIGLGIWLAATGAATGGVFPAERRIQVHLAARTDVAAIRVAARRCEGWSAVTSVLFVVALVIMVWQPA